VLFGFGWARPVPVNPQNFHDPRQGMLQVALAGPLANITVAFLLGAVIKAGGAPAGTLVGVVMSQVVWINVILALFNLIPIPPLDGSRIAESFLPGPQAVAFGRLQQYGTFLLLALLYTGVVGRVMLPAAHWLFVMTTGGLL